ncbi:MAG: DUF1987 domain-containing protein [Proteobacteria bacterium]|nr:DUF1987 domain-containing protein [Pseudomonadota bacterium]
MMDDLIINATPFTPEIRFYYSKDCLEISGESYPENTSEFYGPVFRSLSTYLDGIIDRTVTVIVRMKYFNSSSSKILINLFDQLDDACEKGNDITVNWFYRNGDDDSREFGEEFSEDLQYLHFNIVPE